MAGNVRDGQCLISIMQPAGVRLWVGNGRTVVAMVTTRFLGLEADS